MRVHIKKINGGTQQFAETINNSAPLAVELRNLRTLTDRYIASDELPENVADALNGELERAESEASSATPQRSRLKEILGNIAMITSGITAATGLTDSIEATLRTISSLE